MEKIAAAVTAGFTRLIRRSASYLKFGVLLALVLVLMIPLAMIEGLIDERMNRRNRVAAEIAQSWSPQTLTGPVLVVPYSYRVEQQKNLRTIQLERQARAYFLPERLAIAAKVEPEVRYRGIFEALVYQTTLRIEGSFAPLDFQSLGIAAADLRWQEAVLVLGVADLRGTRGVPQIQWGAEQIALLPGTTLTLMTGGAHAKLALDPARREATAFSLFLPVTGYQSLAVAPAGKTTRLAVTSPWPHPSFIGKYLPGAREIGEAGFAADWDVSYLGRGFPQSWTDQGWSDQAQREAPELRQLLASSFGVKLISPVDFYLQSERSIKHGALFIVLVFAVVFVLEITAARRVHVIQYGLVGCALCLFYLLLISLAEVIGFGAAYGLAALLSAGLIAAYTGRALGSRRRALAVAGLLGTIYGYLFIVLQLESLALISGAGGLFLALAATMYATRNLDWYRLTNPPADPATAAPVQAPAKP